MKKQKSVKYIYQDIRFRIIERSGHWNLDFFIDNKRQRRSTSLKANSDNLLIIKKECPRRSIWTPLPEYMWTVLS